MSFKKAKTAHLQNARFFQKRLDVCPTKTLTDDTISSGTQYPFRSFEVIFAASVLFLAGHSYRKVIKDLSNPKQRHYFAVYCDFIL